MIPSLGGGFGQTIVGSPIGGCALRPTRRADAAVNHVLKNAMAEAGGLVEVYLEAVTPGPLGRGVWGCRSLQIVSSCLSHAFAHGPHSCTHTQLHTIRHTNTHS